jgi:hypothetical protein
VDTGDGLHRVDKSGGDYWLYRIGGSINDRDADNGVPKSVAAMHSQTSQPVLAPADPDTLDKVYRALLKGLSLSAVHRDNLRKRGLSDEEINFREYKSLIGPGRSKLAKTMVSKFGDNVCKTIPGLFIKQGDRNPYWTLAGSAGIIIPLRDVRSRIVALKVRADKPGKGPKYSYITSSERMGAVQDGPSPMLTVHLPVQKSSSHQQNDGNASGGAIKSNTKSNNDKIRLTEGELKADIATVLSGHLTMGIPGVSIWRPAVPVLKKMAPKKVLLAFDADVRENYNVARALQNTAIALQTEGFDVELETWPEEWGKGIDDVLASGYTPEIISGKEQVTAEVNKIAAGALVEQQKKRAETVAKGKDARLPINAGVQDLSLLMEQSWNALEHYRQNKRPLVFVRSGTLTRVKFDKKDGPILDFMSESALRNTLDKVAYWHRYDKERNEKPAFPVMECVKGMLAEAAPPAPRLTRIVQAPVFANDGTLLMSPGYHEEAETWYHKTCDIPDVPEKPSKKDIEHAKDLLLNDLLIDFPFDDESSRSYALAAMIQPFIRTMIDGPTPLHVIDAKSGSGTGKSLLADMITIPALGKPTSAMSEGKDSDEWRKRITAKLMTGSQFTLIDNINRKLDSGELAAAITATTWEDRLLGATRMIQLPVECCWMATGNAVKTSQEIARRIVKIRIDAKRDQPWLRPESEFKHPNIREWAIKNRGQLVWSCLVLGKAWIAEGRPQGKRTLGMFESWARAMGGILDVAGVGGFLGNLKDIYAEMDEETAMWREFISAWWDKHGGGAATVGELHELAVEKDLLLSVLGDKGERSQKIRLGRALSKSDGRYFGEFKIAETAKDPKTKSRAYRIEGEHKGGYEENEPGYEYADAPY